jgi:hypothetical protein
LGIRLDLIIGMDVLGRFPWLLDWQGKTPALIAPAARRYQIAKL